MNAATTKAVDSKASSNPHPQSTRETVESVVVAFILAFLFRAFVAEAFVIPTGSMAPTLMGAHKDLVCIHCGQQYQANASSEFDSNTGAVLNRKTVGSTCSTCRGINAYDFRGNKNHASFSGDRILVSKFDYVLSKPHRWDVLVFKFPLNARMNYIKRLIGLPGETLRVQEGDVYIKDTQEDSWAIARKPPHKVQAMKQVVSDTRFQAAQLVKQGWPSLWQPWSPSNDKTNWTVTHAEDTWSADLKAGSAPQWLRYYHKFVDVQDWEGIDDGLTLAPIDPYRSQLITDYVAYNSSYVLARASDEFDIKESSLDRFLPGFFRRGPRWALSDRVGEDVLALDWAEESKLPIELGNGGANDGRHWVGDLVGEFNVEIGSDTGILLLDLVEFGIRFQCAIDVATGAATLHAIDGNEASKESFVLDAFGGVSELTGKTSIRGQGNHVIELANFDDQITLWVDGSVVEFDKPAQFDSRSFRPHSTGTRRPYWTPQDPLDAAPVGIGGKNLSLSVTRAQVFRDIYYIAAGGSIDISRSERQFSDFDLSRRNVRNLASGIPDLATAAGLRSSTDAISNVYAHPEWWATCTLFDQRRTCEYQLEEGQYFPMGDNSAQSSDARAWWGHHFVEERFLLGKALLVFWPHTWNRPVPFTPNIPRMGLIR